MSKKSLLRKVAKKFHWTNRQAENAIYEIDEYPSNVNMSEFLDICVESKTPTERINKSDFFLDRNLNGKLVDIICDLLYIDPCFYLLAFSNIHDIAVNNEDYEIRGWSYEERYEKPSFFHIRNPWGLLKYDQESKQFSPVYEVSVSPLELTYRFLNSFIIGRLELYSSESVYSDTTFQLMTDVIARVRFLAFNVPLFLQIATHISHRSNLHKYLKVLMDMQEAFGTPTQQRKSNARKRNWLIYAYVTKLVENGFLLKDAFSQAGKVFNQEPTSMKTRYFERKKEANRKGLELGEIIYKNGLLIFLMDLNVF